MPQAGQGPGPRRGRRAHATRHPGWVPSEAFPWEGEPGLGAHAEVISRLAEEVARRDDCRWLEVGCSLGRGAGDELSDIDSAVGYRPAFEPEEIAALGTELVAAVGPLVDVLVHVPEGWPSDTTRRVAAEFQSGVQLDLVLMPAERRPGLPEDTVAVVDKDGRLATAWRPPVADPPTAEQAREWLMLGWWAISDVVKYLRRGSLFEAIERLGEGRRQALRLFAAGRQIPYPSFGLVSLLDFPPFEVPPELAATYCPTDDRAVLAGAQAVAQLLRDASPLLSRALGAEVRTGWEGAVSARLTALSQHCGDGSRRGDAE